MNVQELQRLNTGWKQQAATEILEIDYVTGLSTEMRLPFEDARYLTFLNMALPLLPGLTPPEVAFLCEMELVTVIPRQRLEALQLLGVSSTHR